MSRERRLAENELLFRTLNERLKEVAERTGTLVAEGAAFVCECAETGCRARLRLTLEEYEEARSDPRMFLVVPGHELAEVETVVADHGAYLLVRKTGAAGEVALDDADD